MSRFRWIHSPALDVGLATCWIPFAVAAHWASGTGDRTTIGTVLLVTFTLSFAHQPLTLPIVYGDPEERAARRRLYTWCPVAFLAAAVGGLALSVATVAVIAGLWNAQHTLMQRYGITRIYARKAGESEGPAARLEKGMLVSWLVLAVVVAAASAGTEGRLRRLPLGEVNARGLGMLADLRPVGRVLLPVVAVAVVVVTGRWVRAELDRWRDGGGNGAKLLYVGSTAVLIGVMLVDPVAGFVGYVGAHAVEYFVIVHRSLGSRWVAPGSGGAVGRMVRAPGGRRRFLAVCAAAMVALVGGLRWYAHPRFYLITVLVLGGLHVLYDGFIWKLRRPSVAAGLVTPTAMTGRVATAR